MLFCLTGFAFLLAPGSLQAQNTELVNTLDSVEILRNEKKYAAAAGLLARYEKKFPGNLSIEKIYGQMLVRMQAYSQARAVYRQALIIHPDDPDLVRDFGQLLLRMKDYQAAENLLLPLVNKGKNSFSTLYQLGMVYYYTRQDRKACVYLKKALESKPNDARVNTFYQEVRRNVSPSLQVTGEYSDNSNPIKRYGTQAVFQYYVAHYLQLCVSGGFNHYSGKDHFSNQPYFKIANVFQSHKGNTTLKISLGKLYATTQNLSDWTGDFQFNQSLTHWAYVAGEASRQLYNYTLNAVVQMLMYNSYEVDLNLGHAENWNGLVGTSLNVFPDHNSIISYYAKFLSKPIKASHFSAALGYEFTYSNSKQDRFGSTLSATDLMALYPEIPQDLGGAYTTYYTPLRQFSHNVLTHIAYVTEHITFTGKASVGLYAKTNAPSLTLAGTQNNITIVKNYHLKNYVPITLDAAFHANMGLHWKLDITYNFSKTYFYDSHQLAAGIKYQF